ncbi:MAG: RNase adapter RapZ [Betaproteobacteria bacterium]|nr:RNase adapter RapZ [Betaproteobacteria bacterium]
MPASTNPRNEDVQLILVSGLSGSGKSIALNVLEDAGYYCVDNLPALLLPQVTGYLQHAGYTRVAVAIDVRGGETVNELPGLVAGLQDRGMDARVIFLETKTDTLVKRFSETRRRHPLSGAGRTLTECIEREREMLADIGALGQRIDTSELSPNTLRTWIGDLIRVDRSRLTLLFQSFAFKHGLPLDADLVFDVRCLPNPHYDPKLRPLTGKDAAVAAFIESDAGSRRMFGDIREFLENWLPCYVADNRSYLTVALGCTGGQHRSVYFTERLARHFQTGFQVLVRHRELETREG